MGVVHFINRGRSHNREANKILKNIYSLAAQERVILKSKYVSSGDNISDPLSRGNLAAFLYRFSAATAAPFLTLPIHLSN